MEEHQKQSHDMEIVDAVSRDGADEIARKKGQHLLQPF
jgi:hypothetical protein